MDEAEAPPPLPVENEDPCAICLDTILMKAPPPNENRGNGKRKRKNSSIGGSEPDASDLQPARPNTCKHIYHFHCLWSW